MKILTEAVHRLCLAVESLAITVTALVHRVKALEGKAK